MNRLHRILLTSLIVCIAGFFGYYQLFKPRTTPVEIIDTSVHLSSYPTARYDNRLIIPSVGFNQTVDDGCLLGNPSFDSLKTGVSTFCDPDLVVVGTKGMSLILGHRTLKSIPADFYDIDRIIVGDELQLYGRIYKVYKTVVINPDDLWSVVLSEKDMSVSRVVLVSCTPKGTSLQRILVFAEKE